MPSMEWNHEHSNWIKECSCCHYIYRVAGGDFNEAYANMRTFFTTQTDRTSDGLHGHCKECTSHSATGRIPNGLRRSEMLAQQDGKCAICSIPIVFDGQCAGDSAVIDHDHKTKKIRGVLCHNCNKSLGYVENKEWVCKAQTYLARHEDHTY